MLVAAPYELPGLVSESLKTVSSPNFFMTIAVRPTMPPTLYSCFFHRVYFVYVSLVLSLSHLRMRFCWIYRARRVYVYTYSHAPYAPLLLFL